MEEQSLLQRTWGFLKVRKLWWMTPLILLIILFALSLASGDISLAAIYAPV